MTYAEILERIYGLGRFGMKPGLERIAPLLDRLGRPQDAVPAVHVAGTNGKGSTSAFLASILRASGLRVGLFTSPHLSRYTERITVNGAEIPEDEVVRRTEEIFAVAGPETTFFEVVTATALLHFAGEKVDIAVLEAGMGGRSDATAVAPGILTVITPLGLDHCRYLGDTIETIAREKAAIAKPGTPVVLSQLPEGGGEAVAGHCRSIGSRLFRYGAEFDARWNNAELEYAGIRCSVTARPGIPGRYQAANAASALAAAELLGEKGFPIDIASMTRGLSSAFWPGRMELFPGPPRILLDGAHNPAGARALAAELENIPRRRLLLVVGMMEDKEMEGVLLPLLDTADTVFAVSPAMPAALPSAAVAAFCREKGRDAVDAGGVGAGLSAASGEAGADDLVLVSGSLFTVGEARSLLTGRTFEGFRG